MTSPYVGKPIIVSSELAQGLLSPVAYERFAHFVVAAAEKGHPYTGLNFYIDLLDFESEIDITEEIQLQQIGSIGTVHSDSDSGEWVKAVTYNSEGVSLATQNYRHLGASRIGALIAEKRSDKSLLRARYNLLDSRKVSIEGVCWLRNPRMHKRIAAMRVFANKWGLESAWELYLKSPLPEKGQSLPFKGNLTDGIMSKMVALEMTDTTSAAGTTGT